MSEPTDAQFGNKIKDMVEREGLPFTKGRNEYGRVAWIFSRRGVYDWLTEKEYTEYLLALKTFFSSLQRSSGNPRVAVLGEIKKLKRKRYFLWFF